MQIRDRVIDGGDKWAGRRGQRDGGGCCIRLKDDSKHTEGRRGKQRMTVPSFLGVKFNRMQRKDK